MIEASAILTVGPGYKKPKGGISAVENSYSHFYYPFNHIVTVDGGNTITKFYFFIKAFFVFFITLFQPQIKIIHFHVASNASFKRKAIFILLAKVFNKKIIFHSHGGGFKDYTKRNPRIVRYVIGNCDVVVALSETWKLYFESVLNVKRVVIIPNPVDTPSENHSTRSENLVVFLFLGAINDNKGVFDLLEVVNEYKEYLNGKAKFLLGGNGEIDRLNQMIHNYQIENIVEFRGWVQGEDKIEILNNSHVFVLPSYIEGVPISILEAETYHLPIITTNVGGIPSIVKEGVNGYLLRPGDKQALSKAILEMVSNRELREKMSSASYQYARPHLLPEVEKKLTDLYEELIASC